MATIVDNEVLADAVRNYPVLYDKNSKNFKNRWEKISAWEEVARNTGLVNGEAARVAFYNLRTRFARNLKRKRNSKLKGATAESNPEDAIDEEELFPFLSWLETHIKSRQTYGTASSTTINIDAYVNDDSEEDELIVNHEETLHTDVKKNAISSMNYKPKKKARLLKAKSRFNHELSPGPSIFQAFGSARNTNDPNRYEDEIFSAFIVSQLRHIPHHKKILLKMQISNLIYNEMLASIPSHDHSPQMTPSTMRHSTGVLSKEQLLSKDSADFTNGLPQTEEPVKTAVLANNPEVQATVSLPDSGQAIQAVALPLSDSLTSQYRQQLSQVTVTLPQTVQPIQAVVPSQNRSDINPTWSRLQVKENTQIGTNKKNDGF